MTLNIYTETLTRPTTSTKCRPAAARWGGGAADVIKRRVKVNSNNKSQSSKLYIYHTRTIS